VTDIPVHPVQTHYQYKQGGVIPAVVALRAYEVYKHVHGPQPAMITDGCRGGFGVGEIIGFLYAYPFPKDQWRDRVEEAWNGMKGL
jgi:hypothetical protein